MNPTGPYRASTLSNPKLPLSSVRAVVATLSALHAERLDLQETMNRIVAQARILTNGTGAGIALLERSGLVYRAAVGTGLAYLGFSADVDGTLAGLCFRTGQRVICSDVSVDPRATHPFVRTASYRSLLVVPIRSDHQVIGVLTVDSTHVSAFSDGDVEIAELLAFAVGSALGRVATAEARAALVAERDEVAAKLHELEAIRRAFFEASPLMMGVVQLEGDDQRYLAVNEATAKLMHFTPEAMHGRLASELGVPAETLASWGERFREATKKGGPVRFKLLRTESPSSGVPLSAVITPLPTQAGAPPRFSFITEDISEQETLREQLAAADRRAAVGNLAAGVAHEINNPLAFILANLEFIRDEVVGESSGHGSGSAEVLAAITEAKDGAERVRKIVRTLLSYSRVEVERNEPLQLRGPVETALRMAKGMVERVARLEVSLGEMPLVVGDDLRLGQVFLNLLVNAAQAIPPGQPSQHVVRVSSTVRGDEVAIEVQDSGTGMAPDVAKRIFEPFFTTKPVGVGTGLGLALCQNIVTSLGGAITVTSHPGQGACFRVTLPLAREALAPSVVPSTSAEETPSMGYRVLVVDDEPQILGSTRRLLQGCQVAVETNAEAALGRLERGDRFEVIISDVQMPGVDGFSFADELRRRFPDQAAGLVLTSGSSPPDVGSPPRPATPFMLKPVDRSTLRRFVGMAANRGREHAVA